MVEVSVVLAEALVLEREGAALRRRGGSGAIISTASTLAKIESDATGTEKESTSANVSALWDDEKAAANKRRVDALFQSLNASGVHDLQVLRSSLERQAAGKGLRHEEDAGGGTSSGSRATEEEVGHYLYGTWWLITPPATDGERK